ncbi:uncharacterized protein V6R79_004605 [Siganus canaliculatus]
MQNKEDWVRLCSLLHRQQHQHPAPSQSAQKSSARENVRERERERERERLQSSGDDCTELPMKYSTRKILHIQARSETNVVLSTAKEQQMVDSSGEQTGSRTGRPQTH